MATGFLEDHSAYIGYLSSARVPYPRGAIIELTSACNLKCIMCPRTAGHYRTQPNRNMSEDVLDLVVLNVLPYVERIDVVGDGEAFLQPGLFFRLLRAANLLRIPMTACSNGHLIREPILHTLITHGLHDLNISLDAAQPETYERIRQAPFHRVLMNLRKLHHLKKMYNSPFPRLHLTMVAMASNIEELPELVELAGELGAVSVTLQAMGEETPEVEGESAFHRDYKSVQRVYRLASRISRQNGVEVKRWPESFQPKEFLVSAEKGQWRKDCSFVWTVPYITTTGDIRPCCASLPPVGNIFDAPFREIWFGRTYRAVRRHLLLAEPPAACIDCPGTGWLPATPADTMPVMEQDSRHFMAGFHAPEQDGERTFRWFGGRCGLAVPLTASQSLYLEVAAPAFAAVPQTLTARVNNELVSTVPLPATGLWTTVSIHGNAARQGLAVIDLSASHTVRPTDADPASADARLLGGRLGGITVFANDQFAQFDDGLTLLGYQCASQCAPGQTIIGRMLWCAAERPARDYAAFVHISPRDSGQSLLSFKRLVGAEAGKLIQADHQLAWHGLPTSQWPENTFAFVEFSAAVPPDAEAGEYAVYVGVVPAQGGRRQKVRFSFWKQSASRLEIGGLTVAAGGAA